ncbi:MAG: hypothetical protein LBJ20_00900 [Candidatus Methanoplasma sp.]|nr:hypothetical protein [Candidatus Methanoplasma sp.]
MFTTTKTITSGKGVTSIATTMPSAMARAGGRVLTWGNALKVGIGGAFGLYILNGGLVRLIAGTMKIPEWSASVILLIVAAIVVILIISWIRRKIRRTSWAVKNSVGLDFSKKRYQR